MPLQFGRFLLNNVLFYNFFTQLFYSPGGSCECLTVCFPFPFPFPVDSDYSQALDDADILKWMILWQIYEFIIFLLFLYNVRCDAGQKLNHVTAHYQSFAIVCSSIYAWA